MENEIESIRQFNRTVTRTIGIFGGNYLGRPRPLAASRLLFEIGESGADVRTLRERLGLDSGYLSRLLRTLERESLIRLGASEEDRRVRRAILTDKGRKELQILNRLSDDDADAVLKSVLKTKRPQLIEVMRTVERLLVSGAIVVELADVNDMRAQSALRSYFAELAERFDSGFDPGEHAEGSQFVPPKGLFVMATLYRSPVGCGALQFHENYAEIKRMWVDQKYRGTGTGSRILERLEMEARRGGQIIIRLDTNASLQEAQALYARTGYHEIPRYNDNPYAQRWYEKHLRE